MSLKVCFRCKVFGIRLCWNRAKLIKIKPLGPGRQLHYDLPELLSFCQSFECNSRTGRRIHTIHNRSELAFSQPAHTLRVLRRVSHRGSEQTPVMPEQPPQIETRLRPGRRATVHESAPATVTADG